MQKWDIPKMAALTRNICHFDVYIIMLLILLCLSYQGVIGDQVHVMSVTPTPYGAGFGVTIQPSIVCLLSPPDTGSQILGTIQIGRHVLQSTTGTLSLPSGSSYISSGISIQAIDLLASNTLSQGVFYCEASSRGLITRVPITIMVSYRYLQPSSGMFTITANVGDTVQFGLEIVNSPNVNSNQLTDILWEKQGNKTDDFETISYTGPSYQIAGVSGEHAGVYYAYWRDLRNSYTDSLFRLIVRSCSAGRWDPPLCTSYCDNCYNGGICDDKTGECVCRPGFTGPNCLRICDENKFGWNCEHECGHVKRISSCSGSVFCMPDPVGCSCMTGWMGVECDEECPEGMFGAGCTQTCHCQSGSCDRFTGKCDEGCSTTPTRWIGDNCQIPDTCPAGYYGPQCLEKCYCNNCEKTTGNCLNRQCLDRYYGTSCDMACSNNCITCDVNTGCINSQCYGHWGNNCEIPCPENCFNCNKATGCTGCKTRFWGPNCEYPCPDNCNFCDQTIGCTQCATGFWGSSCEMTCPNNCLSSCDQTKGCTRCGVGFWGPDCNSPCHCQYDTECDIESGKCNYAISISVAPCEPGYVSDSGVNWNNCQKFVSCFSGCFKTCHCKDGFSCFTDTGQCLTGQCEPNWVGASCQKGIVAVSNDKINPGQTTVVTCTVMSESVAPTTDKVTFMDGNLNIGGEIQVEQHGIGTGNTFWNFTSNVMGSPVPSNIFCIVRFDEGNAIASFQPDYYVLPTLTTSLEVQEGGITATSVFLEWDAWNPDAGFGDAGDGPLVAYNIYDLVANTLVDTVSVTSTTPSPIAKLISNLTPNTFYTFAVRPVRQGLGGEGSATKEVYVTTLPDSSQTETPIVVNTMRAATTKQVESGPGVVTLKPGMLTSGGMVTDNGNATTPFGSMNSVSPLTELLPAIIGVAVVFLLVLVFIVMFIWCLRRRRSSSKQGDSLDDVVIVRKMSTDVIDDTDELPIIENRDRNRAYSMPNIDDVGNVPDEVEPQLEKESEQEPKLDPEPIKAPEEEVPLQAAPPPIPTENLSVDGGGIVSVASIKRKLRLQPVNNRDFVKYMKSKKRAELRYEWESFPKNLARPTTVGKKPENKGKNRFRNVVAYDHSRVVLEPLEEDPHSDYINACYIKGINNPKAYIAAQGPAETTIGDYWRMVWQENISVMVMACNVFENGRLKCSKYWPDVRAPPLILGDFTVVPVSEEKTEEYSTVRHFTLCKEGEGSRNVIQFHYTTWPDKDVPRHCTPVLKFIKEVNKHYDDKVPLLIHCSAGAGRTGAIITIHAMMQMAEQRGEVDIYNFVFAMRNSRPNIVQISEQYMFVHDAMLEHLFCKNTFVDASVFANKVDTLQLQNPDTGNTYLQDEYEILDMISPRFGSDKTRGSLRSESLSKLRSGDSVPVDSSRPYLMTPRDDDDMSPYINAAYTNGYKKNDLFITTQMPMADTVVDLWRMVYDYNCTCIVQLNDMDPEDEDCPEFWPDEGTETYGPFSISLMDKENTTDFKMRTMKLIYTKRDVKSPIPVRHFQYMTWPMGDERPASSDGILQLISAVEKWQKTLEAPGPIVVLCMNAAGRTGAFCAIQKCLDQVREEQGADVLQNVKELRIHRTNMVDTTAKFLFCYETILEYLKAFDDYDSKKSYQNVTNVSKPKPEAKKKKKEDDAVIYGNQATIMDLKKGAKAEEKGKDEMPQNASNKPSGMPSKGDRPGSAKSSPSSRRKSAPIKAKPMVLSSTKPKPTGRARPKSTIDGRGVRPSGAEGGASGGDGGVAPKNSVKKQEQLYQNMVFDNDTPL